MADYLSRHPLPANYHADKTVQKVISIVKNYNRTAISRLPSPWGENFNPSQSMIVNYRIWTTD